MGGVIYNAGLDEVERTEKQQVEKIASRLARMLFEYGGQRGSECRRIEFIVSDDTFSSSEKTGRGLCEAALVRLLRDELNKIRKE